MVVVGAGSAGSVLAARLSEDTERTVLLLEAGPADPPTYRGPSFFDAIEEPGRTWPGLLARRVVGQEPRPYVRGRGLGGSSAVNAMIGLWGLPADYDRWQFEHGCHGWGWADIGPVLQALPVPMRRTDRAAWGPVDTALVDGAAEIGWPSCADHHRPGAWGAGPAWLTIGADGRRASAADVYLGAAQGRRNLAVRGEALVGELLLDGRICRGVRLAGGEEVEAGEVVLAVGAIHSPAVLARSGVDRPGIGRGLEDHPSAAVALVLRDQVDPHGLALATLGRFSSGVADADLQLLPMNHLGPAAPSLGLLALALMRAHSRGRVVVADPDPRVEPVVELDMLSDERDVEALTAGVAVVRRLLDTAPFRAAVSEAYLDDVGTPLDSLGSSADDVAAWLRARTGDYVHASGTCRMGGRDDDAAVVDTGCRVIGYEGLRVCDASVLPELPRANTHLTVVAVAELASRRWRAG